MKHISELSGIGTGKRCLIIGGGLSVRELEFDLMPDDLVYISTNNHCRSMADIIIYYDKDMQKYYEGKELYPGQKLIAFKSGKVDYTTIDCTHWYSNYRTDNYIYGDTGFHSLQFADNIFDFSEIYLIGFDYRTGDKTYHHDELKSDEYMMERFKIHSIGRVLKLYETYKPINKIYQCTKDTDLTLYDFKLPFDN